jgi:hypothetical protein
VADGAKVSIGGVIGLALVVAVVASMKMPGPEAQPDGGPDPKHIPTPSYTGYGVEVVGSYEKRDNTAAINGILSVSVTINGKPAPAPPSRVSCKGKWCARRKAYGPYIPRPSVHVLVTSQSSLPLSCTIRINGRVADWTKVPRPHEVECWSH